MGVSIGATTFIESYMKIYPLMHHGDGDVASKQEPLFNQITPVTLLPYDLGQGF